MIRKRSA